jgi:nitrogen fixation NifU-like protein
MTDDLQDLYQQVILDHSRSPRNYGPLSDCQHSAEGYNPLCGDHYKVHLRTDHGRISEVRFEGSGCAISKAAASVMTTVVQGRTREEVGRLFGEFHRLVTTGRADLDDASKLAAFAGVHKFPARVKCALLSWHALKAALEDAAALVTTEGESDPVR